MERIAAEHAPRRNATEEIIAAKNGIGREQGDRSGDILENSTDAVVTIHIDEEIRSVVIEAEIGGVPLIAAGIVEMLRGAQPTCRHRRCSVA